MSIIYVIVNNFNTKLYVGKTKRELSVRWQCHINNVRYGGSNMLICRAMRKHGIENFKPIMIEECDESDSSVREQFWIKEFETHISMGGYNLTMGGEGLLGYIPSEETKEKMRSKATGRILSDNTKAKISAAHKGKKKSIKDVLRRAASNRGKKRSQEQKDNISNGQRNSGYTHSLETRKKIGIASSNRIVSAETRKKLSIGSTGRRHKDKAKLLISLGNSKPVEQYDLDGNLLNSFSSLKAAYEFTGTPVLTIQRSIYCNRPTRRKHVWKFLIKKELN
jgi:group I intron endonuclease